MAPQTERLRREINGPVGFSQLPHQLQRDLLRNGFEFTVMVVGESGLGKSTLLNSLFLTDLYVRGNYPPPAQRIPKTMAIESTSVDMEENGVRLRLTLVDTPGFGDNLNNSDLLTKIVGYIEKQYDMYVDLENRVKRFSFKDTRVHAVLYFIAPTVHGLRALDVEFMKALHKKVNLIPIIAKADSFNTDELARFKQRVLEDLQTHQIDIFRATSVQGDDIDGTKALLGAMPFAVIGSNRIIEENGKRFRGRRYPWGTVDIENEEYSDFCKLRSLFIRKHMRDLYDHTHQVLYEDYRVFKFSTMGFSATSTSNLMEAFEHERLEHERQMRKIEEDLKKVFETKVKEKEQVLHADEMKLQAEFDQLMAQHKREKEEIERRIEDLRAEKERLLNPPQEAPKKKKGFF
eukprot:comp24737_c0_seq1/m.46866 comp24737_c0_seq1/g.46866  ORF comp24737_c0_seq1/g.46866 comp24737_c0_seq1/m.46866 type:complete len:404 (-) comp24737_c0_seq1:739-1950(-)